MSHQPAFRLVRVTLTARAAALALALIACGGPPGDDPAGETAGSGSSAVSSGPARPNLIWISIDGLRADYADTPALARLATDGHRFTGLYAHAPSSLPAHAALFSSRRPLETGTVGGARTVAPEVPLLAEWLGEHGYRTAAVFGSGDLLARDPATGLARGFQHVEGPSPAADAEGVLALALDRLAELEAGTGPFFLFVHFADLLPPLPAPDSDTETAELLIDGAAELSIPLRAHRPFEGEFSMRRGDHLIAVKSNAPIAVRYLRASLPTEDGTDFFFEAEAGERELLVTNLGPDELSFKLELLVEEVPDAAAARARYALEVERVDRAVGALLDQLQRRGLYDDSLLVLCSPHGLALGERGRVGAGSSLHDELLESQLTLKLPSDHPLAAEVARARDKFLRQIDVPATLLELLGQPKLPGQVGTSALEGTYRVLVSATQPPASDRPLFSLRSDSLKLILRADEDRFEMFDLSLDPGETTDVYAERAGEVADWARALRSARDLTQPPVNPAAGGE